MKGGGRWQVAQGLANARATGQKCGKHGVSGRRSSGTSGDKVSKMSKQPSNGNLAGRHAGRLSYQADSHMGREDLGESPGQDRRKSLQGPIGFEVCVRRVAATAELNRCTLLSYLWVNHMSRRAKVSES